jgi:rifampin ADP-ribosylating transferase
VSDTTEHVAVNYDHYTRVTGPFFHGTKVALGIGEELVPGYRSN